MKLLKSVAALLVVAALGIFVYFFIYKNEIEKNENEKKGKYLVRFDFDKVKSFTLARPDSSVVFERGVGRVWNIVKPIVSEASNDELQNLFDKLNKSEILYIADDKPKNLDIYKLQNPQYYLVLNYENGDVDTLFIGSETPDGTMTYVRFASEKRVLTVDYNLTKRLKWPARTYRARTAFNVLKDDIISIDIMRGDSDRVVMVNDGATWKMQEPFTLDGDQSSMNELSKALEETKKTTLVSETPDSLTQWGLDNPSNVVIIKQKFGMPEKMLLIGKRLKKPGATHLWYAKQFDNDLIFTLDDNLVKMLVRDPEWFIDKNPMKFSSEDVNKIVLETGGKSVVFIRDSQRQWSAVSPVDKNIEDITINKLFAITRYVIINKIFSYVPKDKDLVKAGLKKPKIRITLFNKDAIIDEISFGNSFTTDDVNTYFKTSTSPIIYVTKTTVTSEVNKILQAVFGK